MQPQIASVSIVGKRTTNQDRARWWQRGERWLLCLGDGLGGHAAGERAAQCLIDTVAETFAEASAEREQFHQNALALAHHQVLALADDYPGQPPPATTAVTCLVRASTASWAHVGDSRLYHVGATGGLTRTTDHSPVETLLQNGSIDAAQARTHPLRNQVSRTIGGMVDAPEPTVTRCVDLASGDVLALCSDGFWSAFDDQELADALRRAPAGESALQAAIEQLAEQAVASGGQHADNTTALVMRFEA